MFKLTKNLMKATQSDPDLYDLKLCVKNRQKPKFGFDLLSFDLDELKIDSIK